MNFQMNSKVTTHSTGFTGSKYKPDLVGYEKRRREREQESVTESVNDHRKSLYDNINSKRMDSIKEREEMNRNYNGARLTAFKAFMFEGFMNSLYLDKEFKQEHAKEIYSIMENYIDGNGGMELLEKAPKTKFIKELLEATTNIGKDCANDCKEKGIQDINWTKPKWKDDVFTGIKNKVEKDITHMSFDSLSKLVKEKVLTVVQDEKEKSEMMREFEDDISNKIDGAIQEAVNLQLHRTTPVKVPTLWQALMTESYKAILNEGVTFFSIGQNDNGVGINPAHLDDSEEEIDWNREDEEDIDDAFTTDKFEQDVEDHPGSDHDDHYDDGCETGANANDSTCESTQATKSVNMDHVMCEALTKYTLIEFMNTAQFTNLKSKDVQNMAMHLVHDK